MEDFVSQVRTFQYQLQLPWHTSLLGYLLSLFEAILVRLHWAIQLSLLVFLASRNMSSRMASVGHL